jgi:hypothetical protein
VTPAQTDFLVAGSRWVGEFRFEGEGADGAAKSALLRVTERTGTKFRGRYIAEGMYEWDVEGTVEADQVRFDLRTAANRLAEETGATGKAYVTGTVTGREMKLTFFDPSDQSKAAMTLSLRPE